MRDETGTIKSRLAKSEARLAQVGAGCWFAVVMKNKKRGGGQKKIFRLAAWLSSVRVCLPVIAAAITPAPATVTAITATAEAATTAAAPATITAATTASAKSATAAAA